MKRKLLTNRKERAVMAHILNHAEVFGEYWLSYGTFPSSEGMTDYDRYSDDEIERITQMSGYDVIRILCGKGLVLDNVQIDDSAQLMLTDKGRMYFEVENEKRRNFWMGSIIIPILLSIIATLVTNYVLPGAETAPPEVRVELALPEISPSPTNEQTGSPLPSPTGSISHL